MSKGIENHNVSLTKNGYFKLSILIEKYTADELLDHLDEIHLDKTQAIKMLGGDYSNDTIPNIWTTIHDSCNKNDIDNLLILSIIFSHYELIKWFSDSYYDEMRGEINRKQGFEKAYTNLVYALNEAGYIEDFKQGANSTRFNLTPLFINLNLGKYAKEIIKNQLIRMGWQESNDDPFYRTFYEQCEEYNFNKVLGLDFEQFYDWLEGKNVQQKYSETPVPIDIEFVNKFSEDLSKTNLNFSKTHITRFIASLLSKQFLILTGLTGSGKTKIAEAFSFWLTKNENQRCIVAVGADWTNREPLLGFPNALKEGEYVNPDTGLLNLILKAKADSRNPYFLILDEMNLSHVERYFADFLSALESVNSEIYLRPSTYNWDSCEVPPVIQLPKNLFIIGTVNIDETTYMFSPKVLDRANVIEFRLSQADMLRFLDNTKGINLNTIFGLGSSLGQSFVAKSLDAEIKESQLKESLIPFFNQLQNASAEFGYRTAYEISVFVSRYLDISEENTDFDEIIDAAIMQKLLPKLHGSRNKIEKILIELGNLCLKYPEKNDFPESSVENIKYPISYEKLQRMHRRIISDGFTSYAEA